MGTNYTATTSVLLNGKQAEDMLIKLTKRSEELGKQWKKFSEAGDTAGMKKVEKEINSVDKATEKLRKDSLTVEKVLKNLSGATMEELVLAQKKLNKEMSKMDRNSAGFKQASKDAKLLKDEIAKGKVAMGQWRSPMERVLGMAKGLLPAFSFGAIAVMAKKAFQKVVTATDTLGTKWDTFVGGLKSGMDEFWRSIAIGDWSNFTENMKKAIEVGREYQIVLDDLQAKNRALSLVEANALKIQKELEDTVRNVSLQDEVRIAAAEKRIQIEEELAEKRKKIATETYENELMVTSQQSRLSKERLIGVMSDIDSETKAKAEAYNRQKEELKKLIAAEAVAGAQSGVLYPGMQGGQQSNPKIIQLKEDIEATSEAVQFYAEALSGIGNVTDAQLDKLVAAYNKMKNSEVSALENTKRVRSAMYSVLDQMNNERSAKNTKAAKEALNLAQFLELDAEKQKDAINKYFNNAGEGAYEAFIAAIEKSHKETQIDFSLVPEAPEKEQSDPAADYAVQKYKDSLDFKLALNQSMYEQGLIGEQQYQDQLTELTRQAENKRYEIKKENIDKAQRMAGMATNFVSALMDLELSKAGDNEKKKKQIKKKYADLNFVVTASQIIADTAGAIMEGFRELGPIGGAIAAAILGATGALQLGIANAERGKVRAMAKGKYPIQADDGKTYNASYTDKLKTGFYDGPHFGLFNEVPGQPELIIDGATTRKLQIDAPGIIRAIYDVRDGRMPGYATGKYPELQAPLRPEYGIDKRLTEKLIVTLNENTIATRDFMQWRPKVSIELLEEMWNRWDSIKKNSGL
jgi:hypothetical protein